MDKNTPPKHKTPNYRLRPHSFKIAGFMGTPKTITRWSWDAMPLRRNRQDLAA